MHAALAVVLANAHVLTMSPAQPRATVVAVVGERIAYVGDDLAAAKKAAGPGAPVLDMAGRTLIPGFDDAHVHFGLTLTLGSPDGLDVAQAKKRDWLATVEKQAPDGRGWLFVKSQRLPAGIRRAADLESIARPLFVVSAHGGVLNRRGLQLAGFSDEEAPDGFVRGRELAYALDRVLQGFTHEALLDGARSFLRDLARVGITSAQLIDELPDLFEELRRAGELTARVRMIPLGYHFDTFFYEPRWSGPAPEWVRVDGVKYFHDDGARLGRFELSEVVRRSVEGGRRVLVHVLSRGALETLLDGIETHTAQKPEAAKLFRIEHVDEATPEQARRLAKLGIPVCSNPSMIPEWKREGAFPMRTLRDAGVNLCLGSDYVGRHLPARALAPLEGIALAASRKKEALRPLEALEAYTLGSAAAEGQAAEKGSLEPGKLADLVALSADPTAGAPEEIGKIEVWMTMVGGQIVFRRPGFAEPPPVVPPSTIGPAAPQKRQPTIGPTRPDPPPKKR
jgi:predicted amidohydrolase YtcJ